MPEAGRKVLHIDMAYTTGEVRRRKHEQFFEARHSGNFFDRVWGLHPLADRADVARPKRIEWIRFSERQTVIEGAAELENWPKFLLPLNFLFSQLKLLRQIVALAKREQITAVAATDPLYSGLFGLAVSRLAGVPLVIQVVANYDDIYESTGVLTTPKLFPFRWLERVVIRSVLSRADLVAPGTITLREFCVRNGARPDRLSIFPVSKNMSALHHRAPAERPSPRRALKRFGITSAGPFLLSIARLETVKFVDQAIRAMKIVLDSYPSAAGLIAGEGTLRAELEQLAEHLGIRDRVHFLGLVDQGTLSEIIPDCITVSPLTGMALFECAMGGSPVVAYRLDETLHQIIQEGHTGYLVELDDYEEMGRKLLTIIADVDLRAAMSRNIREVALRYTNPEQLFRHEAESYSAMLLRWEARSAGRRIQASSS